MARAPSRASKGCNQMDAQATPQQRRLTPRFLKPVIKSEGFRKALNLVAAAYIRFVHFTSRWTVVNRHVPLSFWSEGRPFILAFWHSRLMMMPYCWDKRVPMNMLISQHRDGTLIANTVESFGIKSIRGSTAKAGHTRARGGALAIRSLIKLAAAGEAVGMTPDGPRGPRMRASDGIVVFARLTGLPVIPVGFGTSRRIVLGTWDRFIIALPFARSSFIWGEPIYVSKTADGDALESARLQIEEELNLLTAQADRSVGAHTIGPEPRPVRALAEAGQA